MTQKIQKPCMLRYAGLFLFQALLSLILSSSQTFAQSFGDWDGLGGSGGGIQLGGKLTRPSEVTGPHTLSPNPKVKDRAAWTSLTLPLYFIPGDDQTFYRLIRFQMNPSIWSEPLETGIIARDLDLMRLSVNASAMAIGKNGNFYTLSLGGMMGEERRNLGRGSIAPQAFAFGSHRLSESVSLLGGLIYTVNLGTFPVLPGIGVQWKISENRSLLVIPPLVVRYGIQLSPTLNLSFFSRLVGSQYRVSNEGDFPGRGAMLTLRQRGFFMGSGVSYRLTDQWALSGEAGITLARQLQWGESRTSAFQSNAVAASPTAMMTLRWSMPRPHPLSAK